MRPRLLLVTDLGYPAAGRAYRDEDIDLAFVAALTASLLRVVH